ncbi:MAG: type II toxin-antitoxin system PemK/MazF family toxin [Microbacteriaceae bacterium]|nr:type II toxin-antitoxin system PemK/MazF family toxin [Microbacteriaceae bacterium]
MELKPGELWWAKPDATVGREQSGRRPVVIVANEKYLQTMDTLALVVPVTTKARGWINHIALDPSCGLQALSYAMTEQVRVISRDRLHAPIGAVSQAELRLIRNFIQRFI